MTVTRAVSRLQVEGAGRVWRTLYPGDGLHDPGGRTHRAYGRRPVKASGVCTARTARAKRSIRSLTGGGARSVGRAALAGFRDRLAHARVRDRGVTREPHLPRQERSTRTRWFLQAR